MTSNLPLWPVGEAPPWPGEFETLGPHRLFVRGTSTGRRDRDVSNDGVSERSSRISVVTFAVARPPPPPHSQAFVTSLIKSDGSILPFFERPIAAILAAMAIGALVWPLVVGVLGRFQSTR